MPGCVATYPLMACLAIMLCGGAAEASKILMLPVNFLSNVNYFGVTARNLLEAGHDVTVLTVTQNRRALNKMGVRTLIIEGQTSMQTEEFARDVHVVFEGGILMNKVAAGVYEEVDLVMGNDSFMHRLEAEGYDLVMVDGFDAGRPLYVIPYRLGVPYVTMTTRHDPWRAGVHALPSVEPLQFASPFTENSSIFTRLTSLVMHLAVYVRARPSAAADHLITRYANGRPPTTLDALYRGSEMWFVNMETICLDWPRIHGYHYQFVGCLNCKEAEELPAELAEFAAGAKAGLIIATFGSALKQIPREIMEKMLTAFGSMEQRVLMRYDGVDLSDLVPPNVKLMKWLPQNDLLGHPNTKLFITHAGANGQQEALYHGVPMLSLPVFGDQHYNAERSAMHNYGLTLNVHTFTRSELENAMRETLDNAEYSANIKACSARMRSMPNVHERIRFWVEHVIQHGGQHLKPVMAKMPLWKVFMLDVLGLVLLVAVVIAVCVVKATKWMIRTCTAGSRASVTKKSN